MYFRNYLMRKMTVNMLKGPKHCWNLHGIAFTIFSLHPERSAVAKCLSYWYLKSYLCLLTYWLQITSVLFVIGRIYALFLKSTSNFEHFQKKRWSSQLMCFWNERLQKMWLDKYFKSSGSEHRWTVNMLKVPKHCWNLRSSTFIIFSHPSERYTVSKILS